jgi:hypothetical protein
MAGDESFVHVQRIAQKATPWFVKHPEEISDVISW